MRVDRADAQTVADRILESSKGSIQTYRAFGSVLRNGVGNDVDLILIVGENIAKQWWKEMGHELRVRMGTRWLPLRRFIKTYIPWLDTMSIRARKHRRIVRASELLGFDIEKVVHEYKRGMSVDIFLFPETWRTETTPNLPVLTSLADVIRDHYETRIFLERIARAAIRIA